MLHIYAGGTGTDAATPEEDEGEEKTYLLNEFV